MKYPQSQDVLYVSHFLHIVKDCGALLILANSDAAHDSALAQLIEATKVAWVFETADGNVSLSSHYTDNKSGETRDLAPLDICHSDDVAFLQYTYDAEGIT